MTKHYVTRTPMKSYVYSVCAPILKSILQMATFLLTQMRTYNFWLSFANLCVAAILARCVDLGENSWAGISLVSVNASLFLIVAVIPLRDSPQEKRLTYGLGLVALIHACTLLLEVFSGFAYPMIGLIGMSVIASVPFVVISLLFNCNKPVLWIPTVPYVLLLLVYLVAEVMSLGLEPLNAVAATLPIVLIMVSAWTAGSWLLLHFADGKRGQPKWGPGTESLAMLSLFAPLIFLILWVPLQIAGDDRWSSVLGIFVSVVLGGAVSKHVTQFIHDVRVTPSSGEGSLPKQ